MQTGNAPPADENECYTRAMLSRALPLAALLLVAGTSFAQAPARHGITLDDLEKFEQVGRPVLSPDGKWVAYTLRHTDTEADKTISQLWMVSWDGTQDIQLTYDQEGAAEPRWSPDGRYLAFTSSRPGKAKGSQVWVLDRRGGEARQLTDVKEDLNEYRWSPDSQQLLLTLRPKDQPEEDEAKKTGKPVLPKPVVLDRFHFKQDVEGYVTERRDHLYLFEVATGKLTKLTIDTAHDEREAEWSPDGKHVAFVSEQDAPDPDRTDNPDIFVTDAVAGSTPRKLTTFTGPDQGPLAWSPDSTRVAYRQATVPGYSIYNQSSLAVMPIAGGKPQLLATTLDRPVGAPVFSADGQSLFAIVTDDRNQYLSRFPINGDAPQRLAAGTGAVTAMDAVAGHTAVVWSTDTESPEIEAFENETLRKLTHHNDALLATLTLAPAQDLSAKTKDGNEVHSLLTLPVGYRTGTKAPMLLFIHGGPAAQDEHDFDMARQLFAAHGYAVLNVNYRGSDGRGFAYSHAISGDWGDKEVTDLLASVDAAAATGTIDANKLAVGGWSYGGILTDYTIATTTRFKAASSGAGMGNLLGLYGVDQYILQYDYEIGRPWQHPDLCIKLSYPFFHADRIKTPTLFMGGDRDFNVPVEGGEQMYQALRDVGTPAELVVYPDQFHGFTRPSFIRDRYQRWLDWYDKYLGLAPTASSKPAGANTAPSNSSQK